MDPAEPWPNPLAPSNRVPDLHVFEVASFVPGDFLKLQLEGTSSPGAPGSFGGRFFLLGNPLDRSCRGSVHASCASEQPRQSTQ